MSKHRDDGDMSSRKGDAALGDDEGTARKKRSDDAALGPDEGTARADSEPAQKGAHAEFGGGEHKHSPHMPGQTDTPNC